MKKAIAIIVGVFIAFTLTACGSDDSGSDIFRVAGIKGPTSIGLVKLVNDWESGKADGNYDFMIAGSADEITPKFLKGEVEIAALPANLAAGLYNNTEGQVRIIAVNTLGLLYIGERGDSIHSISDIKGKTIYAAGKGSTPQYALEYILRKNGMDPDKDVAIKWKSEHTEVVAALTADKDGIAMLPQPFETIAETQIENFRNALDLTEEWDRIGNGSQLVMGVLVTRKDIAEKHRDELNKFLDEYKASVNYVNSNPQEVSELVETYIGIKAPIAAKAIPYCNITYIDGAEMKKEVTGYLQTLLDANPKTIGGRLPKEDFYYEK